MRKLALTIAAAIFACVGGDVAANDLPEVGTYYFPGWHDDPFTNHRDPWAPIRPYPGKQPLIGWYDDRSPTVLAQQAGEMRDAGLSFVVFDWYYEKGQVQMQAPMDAYLRLPGAIPAATLMWCRHGKSPPTTEADWRAVTQLWAHYARNPRFYRIDGHPVIMIFDTARLIADAATAQSSLAQWVGEAQATMKAAGLPAIYFVAGVWNGEDPSAATAAKAGFSAITSYNYNRLPGAPQAAHGYAERDATYRAIWPRMSDGHGGLPVILPLTAGWDRRPWGASDDPAADLAVPTDAQFRAHLAAASALMQRNRVARAVICCWNEYGEGSLIEPTVDDKGSRLAAVRNFTSGE